MKFYVVCWYDAMGDDLSPCFGRTGVIVVEHTVDDVEYVELFTCKRDAETYMQELNAHCPDDYVIEEIEV